MRTHIKTIKYIILFMALLLVVILLAYTQPQKDLVPLLQEQYNQAFGVADEKNDTSIKKSLNKFSVKDVEQTIMQEPSFLGEDINSKLWKLEAEKAVQNGAISTGLTELFNVNAKTVSLNDAKVNYTAQEGVFLPQKNKVILKNNVVIKAKNLLLKTDNLEYELDNAYALSKTDAVIKSDIGSISADKLESFNNGDRFVMQGNVRAKLYNKKQTKEIK